MCGLPYFLVLPEHCHWAGEHENLLPQQSSLIIVSDNWTMHFWSQNCWNFFPSPVGTMLYLASICIYFVSLFYRHHSVIWNSPSYSCMFNLLSLFCLLSFFIPALPAGILCSSLALGEAGIEMYDLVSSCSLVRNFDWLESWQLFIVKENEIVCYTTFNVINRCYNNWSLIIIIIIIIVIIIIIIYYLTARKAGALITSRYWCKKPKFLKKRKSL